MALPKRDIPALIEALRIRALALTGQEWERTATRDMMKEAADRLEEAAAELDRREAELTALEQGLKEARTALTDCHIAVSDIVAAGLKSSKPEAD